MDAWSIRRTLKLRLRGRARGRLLATCRMPCGATHHLQSARYAPDPAGASAQAEARIPAEATIRRGSTGRTIRAARAACFRVEQQPIGDAGTSAERDGRPRLRAWHQLERSRIWNRTSDRHRRGWTEARRTRGAEPTEWGPSRAVGARHSVHDNTSCIRERSTERLSAAMRAIMSEVLLLKGGSQRHNSDIEADVALSRCAPSGPRSLMPVVSRTRSRSLAVSLTPAGARAAHDCRVPPQMSPTD
jgi:hypothetical protein